MELNIGDLIRVVATNPWTAYTGRVVGCEIENPRRYRVHLDQNGSIQSFVAKDLELLERPKTHKAS
jgi:hypothetical protein